MKSIYLLILFISLFGKAQTTILTNDQINVSGANKINFVVNVKEAESLATIDIENKSPLLFLKSGIAPVVYSKDKLFEKKYSIYYNDFGCNSPNEKFLKAYNFVIFRNLDNTFGKKWRKEIRKDILGFKEYKRSNGS